METLKGKRLSQIWHRGFAPWNTRPKCEREAKRLGRYKVYHASSWRPSRRNGEARLKEIKTMHFLKTWKHESIDSGSNISQAGSTKKEPMPTHIVIKPQNGSDKSLQKHLERRQFTDKWAVRCSQSSVKEQELINNKETRREWKSLEKKKIIANLELLTQQNYLSRTRAK